MSYDAVIVGASITITGPGRAGGGRTLTPHAVNHTPYLATSRPTHRRAPGSALLRIVLLERSESLNSLAAEPNHIVGELVQPVKRLNQTSASTQQCCLSSYKATQSSVLYQPRRDRVYLITLRCGAQGLSFIPPWPRHAEPPRTHQCCTARCRPPQSKP